MPPLVIQDQMAYTISFNINRQHIQEIDKVFDKKQLNVFLNFTYWQNNNLMSQMTLSKQKNCGLLEMVHFRGKWKGNLNKFSRRWHGDRPLLCSGTWSFWRPLKCKYYQIWIQARVNKTKYKNNNIYIHTHIHTTK